MSKTVKVKCKYYQVRELFEDEVTMNFFDLRPWISQILGMELFDLCREENSVKGRIEEVTRIGESNVYAMNFMRMDEISTSYILKEEIPAEHIDLEDGEYIAKNTVCLYDAENGIMMIQQNRGGYTERAIQTYINMFLGEQRCCLLPILEKVDFFSQNAEYLKLDVRLANYREYEAAPGSPFEQIIAGMNRLEGVNAHLEMTLGNHKNASLNHVETRTVIGELWNNRGCVSSAKIKMTDDQVSGIYDLFDTLCQDVIECKVNGVGGITFDDMARTMNNRYLIEGAKQKVLKALRG